MPDVRAPALTIKRGKTYLDIARAASNKTLSADDIDRDEAAVAAWRDRQAKGHEPYCETPGW